MDSIQKMIDTFGTASELHVTVTSDGTVEVAFTDRATDREWSEYGATFAEAVFHLEQVIKHG